MKEYKEFSLSNMNYEQFLSAIRNNKTYILIYGRNMIFSIYHSIKIFIKPKKMWTRNMVSAEKPIQR